VLRVLAFSIKSFTLPTEVQHFLQASFFHVAGGKAQYIVSNKVHLILSTGKYKKKSFIQQVILF